MHWLADPQAWIVFLVLGGVDNVIFSILAEKISA